MNNSFVSFLVSTALLALPTYSHANQAPHNGYIIKMKQPITSRSLSTLSKLGVKVANTIPELNIVVTPSTSINGQRLMAQSSEIEYIEPNYFRKAYAVKDNYQKQQDFLWGMVSINAAKAWRYTVGSPEVIVAVSDTGISQLHKDLQPNLWKNPGETGLDANGVDKSKNKIDDDGNGYVDDVFGWNFETNTNMPVDDHYHGTHVAGTIGANGDDNFGIAGVAWKARLMSVKFIGMSGWGEDAGGAASIVYAANNGAKVVNCSWGGDEPSKAIEDAIDYAATKGTIVVAAAGNDSLNLEKKKQYPAAYIKDNLITVAAINGLKKIQLAGFSNYGAEIVHLGAPGDNIYSTFNPMYQTMYCDSRLFCKLSGTSMAAPHVSGAIALLYSVNPKLTMAQVKSILMESVTKSKYLEGKVASGGTLNLANAIQLAQKTLN